MSNRHEPVASNWRILSRLGKVLDYLVIVIKGA